MSAWLRSRRPTVALVSGDFVVRLMIASRVHVMWSSHSLRMAFPNATCLAVTAAPWLPAWLMGAVPYGIVCASALRPPARANAATAPRTATRSASATGSWRRSGSSFIVVFPSFAVEGTWCRGAGESYVDSARIADQVGHAFAQRGMGEPFVEAEPASRLVLEQLEEIDRFPQCTRNVSNVVVRVGTFERGERAQIGPALEEAPVRPVFDGRIHRLGVHRHQRDEPPL